MRKVIRRTSSDGQAVSDPEFHTADRRCQTNCARRDICIAVLVCPHCDPRYRYLRDQYMTAGGTYCVIGSTADAVYGPVSASRVLSLRLCIAPHVPHVSSVRAPENR